MWPLIAVCISLAAPQPTTLEPRWVDLPSKLVDGAWLVEGSINNSSPRWFLFDTGAPETYIDTQEAKSLGLFAESQPLSAIHDPIAMPGVTFRTRDTSLVTRRTVALSMKRPALARFSKHNIMGVIGCLYTITLPIKSTTANFDGQCVLLQASTNH